MTMTLASSSFSISFDQIQSVYHCHSRHRHRHRHRHRRHRHSHNYFYIISSQQAGIHLDSSIEETPIRKCAPFLESDLLSGDSILAPSEWKAVPDIWKYSAQRYGDRVALVDPYHDPPSKMTYKQLEQEILDFSEGIRSIRVKPGEKLALFADNSSRWLVVDQGIMATGAINAVRGSRSSNKELLDIYNHSDSVGLAVDNPELFNRFAETFCSQAHIRFIILMWGNKLSLKPEFLTGIPVYSYEEIIDLGHESRMLLLDFCEARKNYVYEAISSEDVATIVYTSGTSSKPKGVMLTHKNLLHQISCSEDIIGAEAGDRFLSILPPWHAYERAVEYSIFIHGIEHVYTTVNYFKDDLRLYQPNYLIGVPLVFEILYNGIQKQISMNSAARKLVTNFLINVSLMFKELKRISEGKYLSSSQKQSSPLMSALDELCARILCAILLPIHILAKILVYSKIHSAIGISKAGISGGGSLPSHIDKFFEAIDVRVQNGYGLTESSPVVAARRPNCNVLGSVGHPLRYTEVEVIDPETDEALSPGSKGILKVKGPQVMKGYYKDKAATEQVLDEAGWLITGDIGWIAPHHSLGRSRHCGGIVVIEGRAKDTIVLSTGENIEPSELEEAAMRSSLIHQIVVIGQDQRRLGAIVVADKEEILTAAKEKLIVNTDVSELSKGKVHSLIDDELRKWTSDCSFRIGPILVVDEPFTIGNNLMTSTMKIRRDRIVDRYKEEIEKLYK